MIASFENTDFYTHYIYLEDRIIASFLYLKINFIKKFNRAKFICMFKLYK